MSTGSVLNPFRSSAPTRARSLPSAEERALVTVQIARSLDLKLEVFSLLRSDGRTEGRAKNEVAMEALHTFLRDGVTCDIAHARTLPGSMKKRVTFILSKQLDQELELYVKEKGCSKTCVVNAAIMLYLLNCGVDIESDVEERLRWAISTEDSLPPAVNRLLSFS